MKINRTPCAYIHAEWGVMEKGEKEEKRGREIERQRQRESLGDLRTFQNSSEFILCLIQLLCSVGSPKYQTATRHKSHTSKQLLNKEENIDYCRVAETLTKIIYCSDSGI